MKILLDSNVFLNYKVGGISRYHYELFKGISSTNNHEIIVAGKFIKNDYLRRDKELSKKFIYDPLSLSAKINRYLVKKTIKKGNYDLLHPSDVMYFEVDDIPKDKIVVYTIHDMINEKLHLTQDQSKKSMAERANKIIAVSQATKKDVVNIYNIDPEKIEVIYHGSSLCRNHNLTSKLAHVKIPQKYLLYVGNRSGYKNFNNFAKGIAPIILKNKDLHLVCVGKKSFSESEIELLKKLGIFNKSIIFNKINDNQLAYIYQNAEAFVFPSIMEGFGIPILESWACKTPVVLSSNTCFREIAEEGGHYFNPHNPESICESVEKVLFDEALRKKLAEIGEKRLTLFSWRKTVNQTLELYKSLY